MEFTEAGALLRPDPLPLEMGVERLPSGQLHVAARTLVPHGVGISGGAEPATAVFMRILASESRNPVGTRLGR